jgi:hypothetical protein
MFPPERLRRNSLCTPKATSPVYNSECPRNTKCTKSSDQSNALRGFDIIIVSPTYQLCTTRSISPWCRIVNQVQNKAMYCLGCADMSQFVGVEISETAVTASALFKQTYGIG